MKRAIVFLMLLFPAVAFGWNDRYNDDRFYADQERNAALREIAAEARYANEYREYQDERREYEERTPEYLKPMIEHYNRDPQPPKR